MTLTRPPPVFLGSDSTQSEESRTRFSFELYNTTSIYRNTFQSEFLSSLEEDLDRLLNIGEEDTTACREAPIFDNYLDSDDDSFFR